MDGDDYGWFVKEDVPSDIFDVFVGSRLNEDLDPTCNTSKDTQFKCNLKSRTRGLQIYCSNCGFILGYREMFNSESSIQVAMLYLDLKEASQGIQFY